MKTLNQITIEPWYKQGWPWALIAIPFFTVVAGVITFIIANDTSDSLVQDDYYKQGLAINSNFERIEHARKLNLIATITFDQQSELISLSMRSTGDLPELIELTFSHPTLKNKDRKIAFNRLTPKEYVGQLDHLEDANWHVLLEDNSRNWILKSRWLYPHHQELTINSHSN